MENEYIPISSWSEDDRPREKMAVKGAAALSTNELLAILLRSGSGGESALDLARRILADCGNDLNRLARLSLDELSSRYKGMGLAKAAAVIAAMELGRRRALAEAGESPVLNTSLDIYNYLRPRMSDLDHEEFWVVLLSGGCRVKGCERLFSGGWDGTMIDVRMLFRRVLESRASAIVIAHNHPSGNLRPSPQDMALTKKVREAGKLLDINLLDHLIVCLGGYYSFADEGTL